MNTISQIKLSKNDFIVESNNSSLKLEYTMQDDKYIVDISEFNLIKATKLAILCSTYCFIKDFKKKICWIVKDEDNVDRIYDYTKLPLSNILQRVKVLIQAMEIGVYKTKDGKQIIIDEKLSEKIEKRLVLLMASIDDVLLENILELTPDKEDISLNI